MDFFEMIVSGMVIAALASIIITYVMGKYLKNGHIKHLRFVPTVILGAVTGYFFYLAYTAQQPILTALYGFFAKGSVVFFAINLIIAVKSYFPKKSNG